MQDKLILQEGIIRCQALQIHDQLWVLKGNLSHYSPSYNSTQLGGGGVGRFCSYNFTWKVHICSKLSKHSCTKDRLQQFCKCIFLIWNLCILVMPICKMGTTIHLFLLFFLLSSSSNSFSKLPLKNSLLLQTLQHKNFFWIYTWMY